MEKGDYISFGACSLPYFLARRIDVLATALTARLDLETFGHLDLSYAPPFARVRDPLLVAANVLRRQL